MKRYLILLTAALAILCTGCATATQKLTTEENNMIAEYIAGALLKHDLRYDKKLLYDVKNTEEEEVLEPVASLKPVKDEVEEGVKDELQPKDELQTKDGLEPIEGLQPIEGQKDKEAEKPVYQSLSEVYDMKGFEIAYTDAKKYQRYPEASANSYFLLEANANKQLVVLNFKVKNTQQKKKNFCMIGEGVTYRLQGSSDNGYKPLLTALTNDLQYLDLGIEAGGTGKAVIIFEISKNEDLKDYNLYISKDGVTAEVKIE